MNTNKLNNVQKFKDFIDFENYIRRNTYNFVTYSQFNPEWKKNIFDFLSGNCSLPMLYDSSFKFIFDPYKHKNRLGDFISSIIKQNVEILEIIPNESCLIGSKSLVIMDILVRLSDGSVADVEIQKNPYNFAGQRLACYSSDLVLRQYSKLKSELGSSFNYSNMNKIYTIVLYEKTTAAFHKYPDTFIHSGKPKFDCDLELDLIQEYYLIALDIFEDFFYDKLHNNETDISDDRLVGWLSFLTTSSIDDVSKLIELYPWLSEIYEEISYYRNDVNGVIDMYSQMIAELDYNSINYLVDTQKEIIEKQQELLDEQKSQLDEQKSQLDEQKSQLDEKDLIIEKLQNLLTKNNIDLQL